MVDEEATREMTSDEYSRIENGQVTGEAIMFIRSRPKNQDGTIGFTVRPDMPEWPAWESYFEANGMGKQLAFMRNRGMSGYTVPCPNPSAFDVTFRGAPRRQRQDRNVDLSPAERNALVERLVSKWTHAPKATRYRVDDMRQAKPAMPDLRPLTEAEAESMKRMMGEAAE